MQGGYPKCWTTRYDDALRYAHDLHCAQPRNLKAKGVPSGDQRPDFREEIVF